MTEAPPSGESLRATGAARARARGLVGLADLPLVVRGERHALFLAVRRRDDLDGLREEPRRGLRPELGALGRTRRGLHTSALDVRDDPGQRTSARASRPVGRGATRVGGAPGGEPVRGARARACPLHGVRSPPRLARRRAHGRLLPARALVDHGHGDGAPVAAARRPGEADARHRAPRSAPVQRARRRDRDRAAGPARHGARSWRVSRLPRARTAPLARPATGCRARQSRSARSPATKSSGWPTSAIRFRTPTT
jgi:hypothetical protein